MKRPVRTLSIVTFIFLLIGSILAIVANLLFLTYGTYGGSLWLLFALVAALLIPPGIVLAIIAWVRGILRAVRRQQWWWFGGVLLGLPLAVLVLTVLELSVSASDPVGTTVLLACLILLPVATLIYGLTSDT
jgi:hypothetical protein